ncbi:protein arginine N-methyltransferase 7-like [Sinocyclocheilus grahami]|uniref:protein arginine N-methyltransferase 7-like n=1 Tax=Sinocyclocheilus grahami TaxID=75366 RepID=UPI0007ACBE51|nr:PREDICTED: protein arginine N-methyltransferase 7-like [Sinocyclocheilus grahami]
MKTFCGRANPTTGALDWVEESEEYDYHQEIARSCYADMLHDKDRNEKYYEGIRAAVSRVKARSERVVVLDIGTGTGLLSMMAVTAGADYCYAIEVFKPMAQAATCIVERNGFSDKIKVINKHSTEVTVGPEEDVSEGEELNLIVSHDDYSLWYSLTQSEQNDVKVAKFRPCCTCQAHLVWTRPRFGELNDEQRTESYLNALRSWRDHWMQSVYFLPAEEDVSEGEELNLIVSHDDYSLWYSLTQSEQNDVKVAKFRPCCTCQAHLVWTRPRFGELNDEQRTESYVNALRSILKPDSVCLSVSDGSLLPIFAHLLGSKKNKCCVTLKCSQNKVFSLENSGMAKQVIEQVLHANSLKHGVQLLEIRPEQLSLTDLEGNQISVLMGEPYFSTSLLPWHSLFFWYCRTSVALLLHPNATILPRAATLYIVAVEFRDLWRIRAPCGTCEGFDVSPMDEMIQQSLDYRESWEAEPHPLWEYPCRALTKPRPVMTFDFTQCVPEQPINSDGTVPFTGRGRCHGVALWMEYQLTEDITVSMGLTKPVSKEGACEWNPHRKQGVFFFRSTREISGDGREDLTYNLTFEPHTGDIKMDFSVTKP